MGKKFVLSEENGTAANGNPRANGAIDLQLTRTAATQVASGPNSIILGGISNTASGIAAIAGGTSSVANGTWALAIGYQCGASGQASFAFGRETAATANSTIAIGNNNAIAIAEGAIAIGNSARAEGTSSVALGTTSRSTMYNQFSTLGGGIGQVSDLKAYSTTTLLSGGVVFLFLNGSGSGGSIASGLNETWNVQVNWVAVVTAITGTATGISVGDVVTSVDFLGYKRVAGATSISPKTSTANNLMVTTPGAYAACSINYTRGASEEMLLTFTGPTFVGGGSVTMRIVAKLELTQVTW
jgi:hypothetical protein